jgi:hypothetical protein
LRPTRRSNKSRSDSNGNGISFEALGEHILDLERVIGLCRECGFSNEIEELEQAVADMLLAVVLLMCAADNAERERLCRYRSRLLKLLG